MSTENKDTFDYVETSGKALAAATKLAHQTLAEEKKASELIPAVVDLLTKAGFLEASRGAEATKKLASHSGAIDALRRVLEQLPSKAAADNSKPRSLGAGDSATSNGNGFGRKSAALDNIFVGRRRFSDEGPDEATKALVRAQRRRGTRF